MPFRTSILTGPTPLAFGSESPVLTKTSQVPSAQALRFLSSAATNGALVVVGGVDVVVSAGFVVEADRAVVDTEGAGVAAGGLDSAPHPPASRIAGNAMSIRRAVEMIMR